MSVRNVLDWLEEAARLAPEATAFDSPERRLAWAQARGLARRAGSRLASLIPPQSPVLILMEKSPECLCAMLGTAYAGCFYTPLDSSMPLTRMRKTVDTLRPAAILYEEKFA